jgi:hypothetical protein
VRRAGRPRAARVLAGLAVGLGAVVGLSACSTQSGQDLAQQACVHVRRSLVDFQRSTSAGTTPAAAALLLKQADQQLRLALPLAAAANSDDGSWNSLMTTISEGATVDEAHLVPSLRAQCVVADANPNVNPQSPTGNPQSPTGNSTPQNVNPEPASPAG